MEPIQKIPTYVINLEDRLDRKNNIIQEFEGKDEFELNIKTVQKHKVGALGLWINICEIVKTAIAQQYEYILICEDDHQFTSNYSKDLLQGCINDAIAKDAQILSGGVSWLDCAFPICENMYWMNLFSGAQFVILFRNFYTSILEADFTRTDNADYKISALADRKFLIHPFISVQHYFGYSDVTAKNVEDGRIDNLFRHSSTKLDTFRRVFRYFEESKQTLPDNNIEVADDIVIPTYVITRTGNAKFKNNIEKQFQDKKLFDITIIEADLHEPATETRISNIRKIVQTATDNDDDLVIVCEDDLEFTEYYNQQFLVKNILNAYALGADTLSGCTADTKNILPVTENLYWGGNSFSTQFIVLFRNVFQEILKEQYDNIPPKQLLSDTAVNKMVLYPFISGRKNYGSPDFHCDSTEADANAFIKCSKKMDIIQRAFIKYKS